MKKILYVSLCVVTIGAPITINLLKKSAKKYGGNEKSVGIYAYAILFGPLGLLIALLSQ